MCRWRIIADLHDTSTAMIEKSYSANIAHHADEVARRGLLDFDQTPWKIDRTSDGRIRVTGTVDGKTIFGS
jgi:hypothetical protein